MVLLTMTLEIVQALGILQSLEKSADEPTATPEESLEKGDCQRDKDADLEKPAEEQNADAQKDGTTNDSTKGPDVKVVGEKVVEEPSLSHPQLGNPISHRQIIDTWKQLKLQTLTPRSLNTLLQGSSVYTAPPKPKAEPTAQYKALMARLRREEEERSYYRLLNPAPPMETFAQRFPLSSAAHAFASSQQGVDTEDDVTYEEVKRQMGLIANVLVSIICCSVAIWKVARWWSIPSRLAVSFSGSLLVGVAEVVVYMGYLRRVSESKGKEKKLGEVKKVMKTWVVGGNEPETDASIPVDSKVVPDHTQARRRRKEAT